MKEKIFTIICSLILIILFTSGSFAAEDSSDNWTGGYPDNWNYSKELKYQKNRKMPNLAAGLSSVTLSLPSLGIGHAYAGNWPRGLGFTALEVGELFFMSNTAEGNPEISLLTSFVYLGTRIVEIVDAKRTAKVTNAKLKHKIAANTQVILKENKTKLAFSYNF